MKRQQPLLAIAISFFLLQYQCGAQGLYKARQDSVKVPRQPYLRYFTTDRVDRKINFYLSETRVTEPLPLVVYVQGSGANSLFTKR